MGSDEDVLHLATAGSKKVDLGGKTDAGKVADLVVLGRDPLKEDPSTL